MSEPLPAILGLDIGGANIKLVKLRGGMVEAAQSHPFALWKSPEKLAPKLHQSIHEVGPVDFIAATMTGELCDCFETKEQGVASIVDSLEEGARGVPSRWWSTAGQFLSSRQAKAHWNEVAAANWSAAAWWLGRRHPVGGHLWLDVGSTTTDIIPIRDGIPANKGKTDPQRMRNGELVYAGVKRTPLCAVMGLKGAAEFFATTDDLFGVLGLVPEYPGDADTADNRPRTLAYRRKRLARMLCADESNLEPQELETLAQALVDQLEQVILSAIDRVWGVGHPPPSQVLVSGSGEWFAQGIAQKWLGHRGLVTSLSRLWGEPASSGLPALALAHLAPAIGC